jgi:hypothetical protein
MYLNTCTSSGPETVADSTTVRYTTWMSSASVSTVARTTSVLHDQVGRLQTADWVHPSPRNFPPPYRAPGEPPEREAILLQVAEATGALSRAADAAARRIDTRLEVAVRRS